MKIDQSLAMGEPTLGSPLQDSQNQDNTSFPTFHYEGDEELKIPAHGTMLVHYRVTRVVETTTAAGEHYACDVQLKRIISAEPEVEAPSKRMDEAGDALDKLAAEHMAEDDEDDEDDEEND
jgi:hypothetical protein